MRYVVKLGGQVVEEVRRRVQQNTLGPRGWAGDPLYGIRRTLQIGVEHLTAKQVTRLDAKLAAGDPHHEVTLARHCYQKLRAVYHARPKQGRRLVAAFPTCPIPSNRPARPDLAQLEGRDPGLLRHRRRLEWPKRSAA